MGNFLTFRITTGKKEGSVSFKGGIALKNGVQKNINYWPGGSSIYDEDNRKSAIKPKSVVFKYNDILSDPACEIIVRKTDEQLVNYLMAHPAYGRKYKIHDEDEIAREKSQSYDSIAKALDYVRKGSELELKAMAVCVLGFEYHGKSPDKCKAALNEKAIKNPSAIVTMVESPSFESRYMASMAFVTGIVDTNETHTAVVWNDASKGVILHIAKGEKGVDKLTELLATPGDQGRILLQELGNRLDGKKSTAPVVDDKDKEIARLKAELAAAQNGQEKKKVDKPEGGLVDYENIELEQLAEIYEKKFNKGLSIRYKNDRDWIIGKLTE